MISDLSLNAIIRKKHNRINGYINSLRNYPSIKKVYKAYSPIKPTDIPLEKYIKLKKEFLLKNENSEKIRNSRVIF
jgi:hypothetical protein